MGFDDTRVGEYYNHVAPSGLNIFIKPVGLTCL